jgi:hypothetical protein
MVIYKKTGGESFNVCEEVAGLTLNILFLILITFFNYNLFKYLRSASEVL